MEKLEIRAVIIISVRKERVPWKFMKTYSTMQKWAAELKRGRESVEDDGRPGRPKDTIADENVKVVYTLAMCDKRRDLRSIASEVGISFGVVHSILTDILGMSKLSARWVPQTLTDDQKRTQPLYF